VKDMKVTKKLEGLLAKASKKLDAAQDARSEVMDYLEEHYGIDTREEYEEIEDQCTWCYGVDEDSVRKLIEKAK
jgi:hypothetical protein